MSKILNVSEVRISILKSFPPQWSIKAEGIVATLGWKNARLEPRFYIDFPKDGIQDLDFVADAPAGISNPVLSPITGYIIWENPPKEIVGVRVHSSNNHVEQYAVDAKDLKAVTLTEADAISYLNTMLTSDSQSQANATGACVYTAGAKTFCAVLSKANCDTLKGIWTANGKCS